MKQECNATVKQYYIISKIEKVTIALHWNWAARRRANRSGLFLTKFVLRMRTNCYLRPFGQNFDIVVIRLSHPDFLTVSNNLAIRRCFQLFFSPYR